MRENQRLMVGNMLLLICVGALAGVVRQPTTTTADLGTDYVLAGVIVAFGLSLAYRAGIRNAGVSLVALVVLIVGLTVRDGVVDNRLSLLIFLPSVLALVLLNPVAIVISAATTLLLLAARASWQGPYTSPHTIVLFALTIGGIVLARLLTDSVLYELQHAAQHNEQQAAELKLQRDALRKSEQNYRMVVDTVKEIIFQYNVDGHWNFLNRAWLDLTGFATEQSIGRLMTDYIHPDDRSAMFDQFRPVMAGRVQTCRHEMRLLTRDGTYRCVEVFARLARGDNGEPIGAVGTMNDITARRQAELELARSETLRRSVLSSAPIVLFAADEHGTTSLIEGALPAMIEHGNSDVDLLTTLFPSVQSDIARALTGEEFAVERPASNRVFSITYTPLYNDRSAIIGAVGVAVDITTRVEAATRIQRQLRDTLLLNRVIAAGIGSLDSQFVLSRMCAEIAEALAIPQAAFALLDDSCTVLEVVAEYYETGRTSALGFRIPLEGNVATQQVLATREPVFVADTQTEPGSEMLKEIERTRGTVSLLIVPLVIGERVIGTLGLDSLTQRVFSDDEIALARNVASIAIQAVEKARLYEAMQNELSERRRAEAALLDANTRNQALLAAIPDSMFNIRRDGIILDVKVAHDTRFSFPAEYVIGQSIDTIRGLSRDIADKTVHLLDRAFTSRTIQQSEFEIRVEQISGDFEVRVVPFAADEALLIVRDITERKMVDRMKNEFIATVSHELRTPLTSIRGALGLIVGGVAGDIPPQARSMIDIALKNSQRLVRLINDILDVEKIESGKLFFNVKAQSLRDVVRQTIEANRGFAQQYSVQLVLAPDADDNLVLIDADRLTQVITNLISNAVRFSPPGGEVRLTITTSTTRMRVAIIDNGPGIPDEFRSRIFQKFAQADSSNTRKQGGTGLGLSIARAIVEKLNGELGFTSTIDVGATFFFDLPIWRQPHLAADLPRRTPRLLICEDDPDISALLTLLLRQSGFVVDIAPDASSARQMLDAHQYAAMTLDLALPGESGISLLRTLRTNPATAALPVIVVSANAEIERAELAGETFGPIDWLSKPIDHSLLIETIQRNTTVPVYQRPRILHVEDDADVARVIAAIVEPIADITHTTALADARQLLIHHTFDLVIIDQSLPDGDGLTLLPVLDLPPGSPVPVLLFSVSEISNPTTDRPTRTLIKSRTSNAEILQEITKLIAIGRHAAGTVH